MRYLSLFSGVEAASVAWMPFGWEPVAFCEVDEFPSAVLAERFPNVPNLVDITQVDWSDFNERYGAVDLVVGGSPCQSFSVAGKRESLQGASRLMFEYIRAVDEVRPRWFVWENVPGALSAKGLEGEAGGAFRQLLREMGELGYGCAWRVLDAQFARVPNFGGSGLFGPVAQRRRRVFLVGHIGDDPSGPVEVLFERESLRGDNPPSREKRKALAAAARDGVETASAGFKFHQGSGAGGVGYGEEQSSTLTTDWHQPAVLTPWDVQSKRIYSGCGTSPTLPSGTNEGANIQPIVATNVYQFNGHIIGRKPENGGNSCLAADPDEFGAYTLTATDQKTVVYDSEVLAFAQNTRDEVRIVNGDGSIVGALAAQPGMKQTSYVMTDTQSHARVDDELGGVDREDAQGPADSRDGRRQRQERGGCGDVRLPESRGGQPLVALPATEAI